MYIIRERMVTDIVTTVAVRKHVAELHLHSHQAHAAQNNCKQKKINGNQEQQNKQFFTFFVSGGF